MNNESEIVLQHNLKLYNAIFHPVTHFPTAIVSSREELQPTSKHKRRTFVKLISLSKPIEQKPNPSNDSIQCYVMLRPQLKTMKKHAVINWITIDCEQ